MKHDPNIWLRHDFLITSVQHFTSRDSAKDRKLSIPVLVKKPKVTKRLDAEICWSRHVTALLYPPKVNMYSVKVMVSKVRISFFLVSFSQLQKGWEVMSICGDERWLSQSLVMIKFAWSIIHINVLFKFDPKLPKFWFSMEKSCQG